jgi:hypothetical protein
MICTCPAAATIQAWTNPTCKERIGQVQRLWFQRIYSTGTTKNLFTIGSTDDADVIANVSTRLTATNGTTIMQSPIIENVQVPQAGLLTTGGGDESLNGVEVVLDSEPTTFNGMFYDLPQNIAKLIKLLACEVNLGVFLINQYNQVIGIADNNTSGSESEFYPIPIAKDSFHLSDKILGQRTGRDGNALRFQLYPGWSDNMYIVTPSDFNPLDELPTS